MNAVPVESLMRLLKILVSPCLAVIYLSTGCARDEQFVTPRDIPDDPVRGGTLSIAIQSDGRSLDPHRVTDAASMRLIENMYGTLMRYSAEYGDVEPYIAESYEVSEDHTGYTFKLRPGIRFNRTGRELTSTDVKYSIRRIIENEVRAEHFAFLDSMDTPDDRTIVFNLARPMAPFLIYLAHPMNAVVDRDIVEAGGGSLDNTDAGTGPFRLVEWRRDLRLVMDRNEEYHVDGLPYLDRIVYRPIPDETARTTSLRMREIDISLDVPDKDRSILQEVEHVTVESVPGTFWEYVGMNNERAPFDDKRVRQAVAWSIDRAMANQLVKLNRSNILTGGFFPSNHWAYSQMEIFPERDTEKALELLQEAGLPDGFDAVIRVGSAFPYQVAAAQVIKQNLEDVGIMTEILSEESSVFFDALARGDFDMTVVGWLGFVDPDEWLYNIFHSDGRWNQQNYSNPEVDELLEKGRLTSDRENRREVYHGAQKKIVRDAPVALLYINEQTSAFLDAVQGFRVHPAATTLSLRETWLAR